MKRRIVTIIDPGSPLDGVRAEVIKYMKKGVLLRLKENRDVYREGDFTFVGRDGFRDDYGSEIRETIEY